MNGIIIGSKVMQTESFVVFQMTNGANAKALLFQRPRKPPFPTFSAIGSKEGLYV